MSRRTRIAVWFALALAAAYFVVTAWVRRHVDDLIQHAVGKPLPAFTLVDRAGKTWTSAELGGRRAVLHFFRSRCHSCDAEAPAMRELEAKLRGDVVMLHVMTDVLQKFAPAETAATLAHKQFARPVVMADAAFADAFHSVQWSNVTPVTYVVDAKGVVRYGLRGSQTRERVEEALAAAR
jgi:cytochrome c biogenesis protein CcmG/thiol:disulfide interchange protein DsbE